MPAKRCTFPDISQTADTLGLVSRTSIRMCDFCFVHFASLSAQFLLSLCCPEWEPIQCITYLTVITTKVGLGVFNSKSCDRDKAEQGFRKRFLTLRIKCQTIGGRGRQIWVGRGLPEHRRANRHRFFILWDQQFQCFLSRAFKSIRDVLVDKR